jgi:hypothetical protein
VVQHGSITATPGALPYGAKHRGVIGGIREIRGDTGFLHPPDDPVTMVQTRRDSTPAGAESILPADTRQAAKG